jgi:4'-phosphopantetheinyl transferase
MLDLWLQPVDEASVQWAQTQSSVLDEEEERRWRRYRTSESRALFLVAHVATRHVLSHSGDRDPESWVFDRGANGRPEIVQGPRGMRFNISHTEGMVAVLVHGEADCGVDVEHSRRSMDIRSVSRRVFTDGEQAAIFSQPPELRADRFYQLWTLKEAFIKAKGKGLALPLRQFSFEVLDEQRGTEQSGAEQFVEFDCDPALDPAPSQWQFFTHRPESGHIVSIAAHRGAGDEDTSVVIRQLGIEATGTATV